MSEEMVAAMAAVVAGMGTFFLQRRWSASRAARETRQLCRHLLSAHSDAEAVFAHLDRLRDALTQRGRLRISSIVVERAVRDACLRLARQDFRCAFEASEFLASLDIFEAGLRRLSSLMSKFIDTYPEDGAPRQRHKYISEQICAQAWLLKMDRLSLLNAELELLNVMPGAEPSDILSEANKRQLAMRLKGAVEEESRSRLAAVRTQQSVTPCAAP